MMRLRNLCKMFDVASIVEKQSQVSGKFTASSENIYSDGHVHQRINSEGYIEITKIDGNPNYVIFLDRNGEIFIQIFSNYIMDMYHNENNEVLDIDRFTEFLLHRTI